jgi:predicted nucleic acid binding AN1-type Zn finger protein
MKNKITFFFGFFIDLGQRRDRKKNLRLYIYTHRSKKTKKKGQHTNIVLVIIIVIANNNLGVHNTPYKHNEETKTTSKRKKVNVIEDDIRSIISAMSDEK